MLFLDKGCKLDFEFTIFSGRGTGGKEPTEEDSEWSSVVPKSQWEVLQVLQSAGFTVNDDNRLFESFDSALEYARR